MTVIVDGVELDLSALRPGATRADVEAEVGRKLLEHMADRGRLAGPAKLPPRPDRWWRC
jgi:hypothetical protein